MGEDEESEDEEEEEVCEDPKNFLFNGKKELQEIPYQTVQQKGKEESLQKIWQILSKEVRTMCINNKQSRSLLLLATTEGSPSRNFQCCSSFVAVKEGMQALS